MKQTLFERACRVSCTANHKDPDEVIANPYSPFGGPDGDEFKPRWKWVAEICGKEIKAIIEETKSFINSKS